MSSDATTDTTRDGQGASTESGAGRASRKGMGVHVPRPRAHWTPRYVVDRIAWGWWQRRNASAPWLVPQSVEFLDSWLRPTDTLVEFGSGRSTVWFASRVARVVSIEDHREWYDAVSADLKDRGLSHVVYRHAQATPESYVGEADRALEGRADMILIDGKLRDHCALWALGRVAPGGIIVIDNVNRYLPSRTRSPASIPARGKPETPLWEEFADRTEAWRRAWFSSGVTDTLAMFSPQGGSRKDEG